jgi:hypothetical protein
VRPGRVSTGSGWFVIRLSAIGALAPLGTDIVLPALPIMVPALNTSDGMIQATLAS